jgi:hypothetical protein
MHQRRGLPNLSRHCECAFSISERRLWMAEEPKSPCPTKQGHDGNILAKTRCQRAMLGGIASAIT